jgi:hypothetical protein
MVNRLAGESSPYLLQHAHNPVAWYPWGEEALDLARRENKPILLSIGYSACHWCHVMAHESFEDADIAAVMNGLFVNIKVDREERPDLDQIYQNAHQLLTGRAGGWPLTMFLTPDGMPYWGGTYFPAAPRHGLPAFADLCHRVAEVYRLRPAAVAEQNRTLGGMLAAMQPAAAPLAGLDPACLRAGREILLRGYDSRFGGFGGAPKFPHPTDLAFLLRRAANDDGRARDAAMSTLARMAEGGIHDQLGGGFFRYSVDERWEIPHFEKMLYDNALLLGVYADAWMLDGRTLFARVAERTAAWALREMQLPEGGFASSLDADSEGEEGRYYVWRREEIREVLDDGEWRLASRHWGLDGPANFEQRYWHLRVAALPELSDDEGLDGIRGKLSARRDSRLRPRRDDKVLTAWNALLIEALARAGRAFGRSDWLAAARRALDYLRASAWRDGRLLAIARNGGNPVKAYLDDHAFLLAALVEMTQAQFRPADLDFAVELADAMLARFEDRSNGGFYFTADDHEALIDRPKTGHDHALPAGNAVAALALLRLARLVDEPRYRLAAERTLQLFLGRPAPQAGSATMLLALGEAIASGPGAEAMVNPPACSAVSCPPPAT